MTFFRFQATHGVAVLDIGEGNPSIFFLGQGDYTIDNSVRVNGKLRWVQFVVV